MTDCNPNTLLEAAKCFECLDRNTLIAIQTQLIKQAANDTHTVQELVDLATTNGFVSLAESSEVLSMAVQNQLLCNALG